MVDSKQRYKAYPEYKDSGVEWLGKIPPHWEISKLRYMFDFGSGLNITKANLKDTGIPCINYGEVHSKFGFEVDTKKHDLKCVDEKYLVSNPSALLYKGDLVFADTSEDIEGSGNFTQLVSDEPAFAGYHTVIARLKNDDCSRFYAYLMDCKEIRTQIRHIVKGVKVFTISQSILKGVNIWLPSLEERQTIANFLDYETSKIDTLIEKQQRLIELLTEKRQAVISHAVTKGLNPEVPMKESGVEWLGEVPAHWEVKKIKHFGRVKGGFAFKSGDFVEAGYPVLKISNISHLSLNFDDASFLPNTYAEIYSEYKAGRNSLAFAMTRPIISGGIKVARVPNSDKMPLINQRVGFLELDDEFLLEFILFSSMSNSFSSQFSNNMTITNQPNISSEGIESVSIPIPPRNELVEIVDKLKTIEIEFEELQRLTESQVELLQERRTALISAAVTGKIDVRDWVKPE